MCTKVYIVRKYIYRQRVQLARDQCAMMTTTITMVTTNSSPAPRRNQIHMGVDGSREWYCGNACEALAGEWECECECGCGW